MKHYYQIIIIASVSIPTILCLGVAFKKAYKEIISIYQTKKDIDNLEHYSDSEKEFFKQIVFKENWID